MKSYSDNYGNLIVIHDIMNRGKTSSIGILSNRAQRFKHAFDLARSHTHNLWTHDEKEFPGSIAHSSWDLFTKLDLRYDNFVIDECQFFDHGLLNVIEYLLERGKNVFVGFLHKNAKKGNFGFADFGTVDEIYDIRTFGGEVRDFFPEIGEVWDWPDLSPHFQCSYVDEGGNKCERMAIWPHREIQGVPAQFTDPNVVVGGMELYMNRCAYHCPVPGIEEHMAVRDMVRLLAWRNWHSRIRKGTTFAEMRNITSKDLDRILRGYYDAEHNLLGRREVHSQVQAVRTGISQVEIISHPELGRFQLYEREGIEEKLYTLEDNDALRICEGIVLP